MPDLRNSCRFGEAPVTDSQRIHRLDQADDFTVVADAAGPGQAVIEFVYDRGFGT